MIIAKPVIDKQFWILKDGDRKVGNVEACAGFELDLQLMIALCATESFIKIGEDKLWHIQPQGAGQLTAYELCYEHFSPLCRTTKFNNVIVPIAGFYKTRQGSAFAQWQYIPRDIYRFELWCGLGHLAVH